LTRGQWGTIALMSAVVLGLHLLGFGLLFGLVAPHRYRLGGATVFAAGTGLTAYTLGMRHAFDADHISAIDNVTRKLMADGKRPLSVGLFFSLGHSTIVLVLALLFAVGLQLASRGLMNRVFGRFTGAVSRPWHMWVRG
jgi:nickel/cobalt transporter (NiCoT) family protein